MAGFQIDGRDFTGQSLRIDGAGRVFVDGVPQDGTLTGVVEVRIVEGVLGSLTCDSPVHAGEVKGDVHAGMSVTCGNVGGHVISRMSVECGDVAGDIQSGMSVTVHKKGNGKP